MDFLGVRADYPQVASRSALDVSEQPEAAGSRGNRCRTWCEMPTSEPLPALKGREASSVSGTSTKDPVSAADDGGGRGAGPEGEGVEPAQQPSRPPQSAVSAAASAVAPVMRRIRGQAQHPPEQPRRKPGVEVA